MSGVKAGARDTDSELEVVQDTLDQILKQLVIMNELLKGILQ